MLLHDALVETKVIRLALSFSDDHRRTRGNGSADKSFAQLLPIGFGLAWWHLHLHEWKWGPSCDDPCLDFFGQRLLPLECFRFGLFSIQNLN